MRVIRKWTRLDNAAKIFPPTSSSRDPKVFRFACELYETVDAKILQRALDQTTAQFPFYRSILKKGLFWYYFEESTLHPTVKEEDQHPCAPIYSADRPDLLFRVCYYKKRISLEVFHALADGMGALLFLRTLVLFYLAEKHPDSAGEGVSLDDDASSQEQIRQDAFEKYYDKDRNVRSRKAERAYRIGGPQLPRNRLGIMEGVLSVKSVLTIAHEYHASLTEFLTAQLICSVHDGMTVRDCVRPVVITVPVDLRNYFETQTARNFFGIIHVAHHFKKDGDSFPEVLENVKRAFKEQLSSETMRGIINHYCALENNVLIKAIPLEIKIPCLKLAGQHAEGEDTAAISNLGKIAMPLGMDAHIRLFSVMVSTRRPQICLCSFGDTLTVSYSARLESTGIPRCFFRRLADFGIGIEINSNLEQLREESDDVL
ncbi:MAG: hypothetical protein E7519_15810 [Ruminococcaceae bacterium]|nr:hypothetical protein [Oscillospiraceae bacterium]